MNQIFKGNRKTKKITAIVLSTSLLSVIIVILQPVFFPENILLKRKDNYDSDPYTISNVTFQSDVYTKDMSLDLTLDLANHTSADKTLWLGFSLLDPLGEAIDFPLTEITIDASQSQSLSLSPSLADLKNEALTTGPYTAKFALWDSDPITDASSRQANVEIAEAFRIYNTVEHFQTIDDTQWFSRDGLLGRTQLRNEHVAVMDDRLTITMPAETLEGGEIQTVDRMPYGSYEISMKLPDAPSSLTGFFLYKAPDFHHEIDIEIFNQPESEVLFTSYSQGSTQHENRAELAFDPTVAFHRYRIDYYPEQISFYIDDQRMQTWKDGYSTEPMHLMVNTWFPKWLEGNTPEEDQTLEIEWIGY
ncbi:MAG: glycoside hydrolase family 16 protein [Alkalibacterium sp.]|uniref:glycoside hydrolase family 16 protein n=1 Tax=Alkalibacterium sp. TaxID=1872447 RepID=UPI003970CF02